MCPHSPKLWCHHVAIWSGTGFNVCSEHKNVCIPSGALMALACFFLTCVEVSWPSSWAQSWFQYCSWADTTAEFLSLPEMKETLGGRLPARGVQGLPRTVEESGHNSVQRSSWLGGPSTAYARNGFAGKLLEEPSEDKLNLHCWLADWWQVVDLCS